MKLRPLIWGLLLAAAAFSLARALVTNDGVGPIEYAVGIVLVALLAVAAVRAGRRAVRTRWATAGIRDARRGDGAALAALVSELGDASGEPAIERTLGSLGSMERVIVAEDGGEVLGFASAAVVPFFHDRSRRLRLTAIAVAPAYRGRGVARGLVAELERWGRELGCNLVEVTSAEHRSDAHAAYRALGFAEASRRFVRRL